MTTAKDLLKYAGTWKKDAEMTQEQKCHLLTLAMGKCWHEKGETSPAWFKTHDLDLCVCKLCGEIVDIDMDNPNYYTKEGFWDVWEWAKEQEWWFDFTTKGYRKNFNYDYIHLDFIDYHTFPDILIQFLLENVELWGWVECKDHYDAGIYCDEQDACLYFKDSCKLKHPALIYIESLEAK